MHVPSLLVKKRHGHPLTDREIRFLVDGYCRGDVADYQMSAFAMAVCLQGMNPSEITTLTEAMLESGDRLPRQSESDRIRVDKHSTGGLGDKISLILAPLLAAAGFDVPMISGRGLGISGGTLDKLESIPGFRVDLSPEESATVLAKTGVFIVGACERIAPADRKLYALRDVTGTVESIALITASILSKKLAASLDALVMDVKVGSGGFMKDEADAVALAESLRRVGAGLGMPTAALLTDMDQPLGYAVGNACEVNEAIEVLDGQSGTVRDLTLELATAVWQRVADSNSDKEFESDRTKTKLARLLDEGYARERFDRMVHAQSGVLQHPLPMAPAHTLHANRDGFVARFDCGILGSTVVSMGGGRRRRSDVINHSVGLRVYHRIGDAVKKGDPLLTLYCPTDRLSDYLESVGAAVEIRESAVPPRPLIMKRFA
ncbi:MAG: thymidine phosphorylase [Rubripirellula sp.]